MEMLFSDKNRNNIDCAPHNHNTYDYYDSSAREDISIIRNKLNDWFSHYPDKEKQELKSRFKKTFSSAFYELFLFELFRLQGFKITIHPRLSNSDKCPDFLISKNSTEIYIEAKEIRDKTSEEEAKENRINQIYDSLEKIKTKDFFLDIKELNLKSEKQPAIKKYIKSIEHQLNKFDPDDITQLIEENGFDESPLIQIDDEDVSIKLSIVPKDSSERGTYNNPIGIYSITDSWEGPEDAIRKSFSKKAKRYGRLDKPYLICLNTSSNFVVDSEINNTIWGTPALESAIGHQGSVDKLVRLYNGIFSDKNSQTFKNVSGVLITNAMTFNIAICKYWLAKHQNADNILDFNNFDMSYQFAKDNKIWIKKGKSISDILNIKEDWIKL